MEVVNYACGLNIGEFGGLKIRIQDGSIDAGRPQAFSALKIVRSD